MDHLNLHVHQIKAVDDSGEFEGMASTYGGDPDEQNDIVDRGAFARSIAQNGGTVPLLYQHDPNRVIGKAVVTDAPTGLRVTGRITTATQTGREAYALLKDGLLNGLSIGYTTRNYYYIGSTRHLKDVDLHEISIVTLPILRSTLLIGARQHPASASSRRRQRCSKNGGWPILPLNGR